MSATRQDETVFVSAGSTLDGRIRKLERANRIVVGACVLIVAAWIANEAWKVAAYSNEARLQVGEFCRVDDPHAAFKPTVGYLWSREHELAPLATPDALPEEVAVDEGTIVEVWLDGSPRSVAKVGQVEVDSRPVSVRYVTGPYSGRRGLLSRYKLAHMGRFWRD